MSTGRAARWTANRPRTDHTLGASGRYSARVDEIATSQGSEAIVERLTTASRRGRLAGFERRGGDVLFVVDAFGSPFDGVVEARWQGDASGGRLRFALRMKRRLPVIFAVVLAATVWPGVYFTDQLIPGEWGWIPTWWWYLPLTVVPIPWVWRGAMRKSRAAMEASAKEAIAKVRAELERP